MENTGNHSYQASELWVNIPFRVVQPDTVPTCRLADLEFGLDKSEFTIRDFLLGLAELWVLLLTAQGGREFEQFCVTCLCVVEAGVAS